MSLIKTVSLNYSGEAVAAVVTVKDLNCQTMAESHTNNVVMYFVYHKTVIKIRSRYCVKASDDT